MCKEPGWRRRPALEQSKSDLIPPTCPVLPLAAGRSRHNQQPGMPTICHYFCSPAINTTIYRAIYFLPCYLFSPVLILQNKWFMFSFSNPDGSLPSTACGGLAQLSLVFVKFVYILKYFPVKS